jgi:2'-5' RNA ligase
MYNKNIMPNLAIDIVILPPKKISDLSIQLSKNLKQGSKKIILNKHNTLPHISLLMGCIPKNKLPLLQRVLLKTLKNRKALSLKIIKYHSRYLNELQIQKTKNLIELQIHLIKICKPLLEYDAKKKDFFGKENVSSNSMEWVNDFMKNSTGKRYSPHITLGYGTLKEKIVNIPFKATKIAICHLGSHCTCKKVFYSYELQ